MYESKNLPFKKELGKISKETIDIHHDKLYTGYVAKMNEIAKAFGEFVKGGKSLEGANQTYSEFRGLKEGETFATNGVYLHEHYFNSLGGDGEPKGSLFDAMLEKWGTIEKTKEYIIANGLIARGWVVIGWDTHIGRLKVYTGDAHNHGGVWGCIPVIVIDVYEHAYFKDFGSDRKAYLEAFWNNLNWDSANERFDKVKEIKL